jgi:hypothetical protein
MEDNEIFTTCPTNGNRVEAENEICNTCLTNRIEATVSTENDYITLNPPNYENVTLPTYEEATKI